MEEKTREADEKNEHIANNTMNKVTEEVFDDWIIGSQDWWLYASLMLRFRLLVDDKLGALFLLVVRCQMPRQKKIMNTYIASAKMPLAADATRGYIWNDSRTESAIRGGSLSRPYSKWYCCVATIKRIDTLMITDLLFASVLLCVRGVS